MDIMASHRGIIRNNTDGTETTQLEVELPLLFTRTATGPSGIIDIVVASMQIDGVSFEAIGEPSLHGFSTKPSASKSARGALIKERPIKFRPDEQGGNTLVISFQAEGTSEETLPGLSQSQNVSITLYLLFSNLARLTLVTEGERLSSGAFVPKRISRTTSPLMVNANLIALGIVAGILVLWNTRLNANVHEQAYAFSQTMIVGITGSLLTFLGLSLGQMKAWLAALTETLSVLRYPELHVNSTLLRLLSSPGWSVALLAAAIFSGWVIFWNWSESIPKVHGFAVYDSESREIVKAERIYRRDLQEGRRFALVCKPQSEEDLKRPIPLGFLKPWREIEDVRFRAEYHRDAIDSTPVAMEHTGREWLNSEDLPGEFHVVQEVLCSPRTSEPILTNDRVVIFSDTGNPLGQDLVISNQRIWELQEVSGWMEDFKASFRSTDFDPLFDQREVLLLKLEEELQGKVGNNGLVPFEVVHTLTRIHLSQITDQKKAVERSVLLRGLWKATSGRRSRLPEEAELLTLANAFQPLLASNAGWKVERVLQELLLDIQIQNPSVAGGMFHEAVVASWMTNHKESKFVKICDYLTVSVAMNAVGEPQRRFLLENWRDLKRWTGAKGLVTDWLLRREELERNDPFVSKRKIYEQLKGLERGLNLDSNVSSSRG